jgi:heme O synthase-like polyprenyltransferase
VFIVRALQLRAAQTMPFAVKLFRYSILYLTLLFGAVAVDVLVRF